MEAAAHLAQAAIRIDHNCFWGLETLTGFQFPGETKGLNAHFHPSGTVLFSGYLCGKIAGIHQAETIGIPVLFGGLRPD